jgi:serine/threonine protein kinase
MDILNFVGSLFSADNPNDDEDERDLQPEAQLLSSGPGSGKEGTGDAEFQYETAEYAGREDDWDEDEDDSDYIDTGTSEWYEYTPNPLDAEPRIGILCLSYIRAAPPMRANRFRRDQQFANDKLNIEAKIASGGFGEVYKVRNMNTGRVYAMKVQENWNAYNHSAEDSDSWSDPESGGPDKSPTLPRTSDASIQSRNRMRDKHLFTKRFQETKNYLEYMKDGHRNVCNLEAFLDIDGFTFEPSREYRGEEDEDGDNIFHVLIFEYCNIGTLEGVENYYADSEEMCPEGFIWSAFADIVEGLTFLHGEHPDYVGRENYHGPTQIVLIDIKSNNIFLHFPSSYRGKNRYPIVKLAEFGLAIHLPPGGRRNMQYGNNWQDAFDNPYQSAKYDVWSAGCLIYGLMRGATRSTGSSVRGLNRKSDIQLVDASEVYDRRLQELNYTMLTKRPEDRISALELLKRLKPIVEEKKSDPFVPLPDEITLIPVLQYDMREVESLKREDEVLKLSWTKAEVDWEVEYYRRLEAGQRPSEVARAMAAVGPSKPPDVRRRRLTRTRKYRAYRIVELDIAK